MDLLEVRGVQDRQKVSDECVAEAFVCRERKCFQVGSIDRQREDNRNVRVAHKLVLRTRNS